MALGAFATLSLGACGARTGLVDGELADAGPDDESSPPDAMADRVTPPPSSVLSVGLHYACLVATDALWCWGRNQWGQLGDGTTDDRSRPVRVNLTGVVDVSASGDHTCARLRTGAVYCWGLNLNGEVGDGETNGMVPVTTPAQVVNVSDAVALAEGSASHACAQLADGTSRCWGVNGPYKCFDQPDAALAVSTPVQVDVLTGARSVAIGGRFTCAILADGSTQCVGDGYAGQLGDGTQQGRSTFAPVAASLDAVAVSCGDYNACALLSDHTVDCWGAGPDGSPRFS